MPLDTKLDYTPPASFNDIQFSSESINIIVSSLLLGMILANLDAIVSKIMTVTPSGRLKFSNVSRGYIFNNSNDLLKLISWIRGRYPFRDPSWNRLPNYIRLRRLTYPLLARGILSIASLAAIAITLPTTSSRINCRTDYALFINLTQVQESAERFVGLCQGIPLVSERGDVSSTASFCYSPTNRTDPRPPNTREPDAPPAQKTFSVVYDRTQALLQAGFVSNDTFLGLASFAEWVSPAGGNFRSDLLLTIQPRELLDLGLRAIRELGGTCSIANTTMITDKFEVHNFFLNCTEPFDDYTVLARGGAFFVSGANWIQMSEVQPRYQVTPQGTTLTRECPISVLIARPIVNLLPLTVIWLIAMAFNVIIGYLFRHHDDVMDVAFHIVKEAAGADCTSNVLEESEQFPPKKSINIQKTLRGRYGHIGFLPAPGEVAVDDFGPHVVVCNKL